MTRSGGARSRPGISYSRIRTTAGLRLYNLFNHENYGTYETRESNASYGLPIPNVSLVYQPRMLQLGFRTTF